MTKVEMATNKIAKDFDMLARAMDASMGQLTDDQVAKVFSFLGLTLTKVQQQVLINRQARVTAGGFSLDMELPTAPSPTPPALTYPPGVRGSIRTPEGRLFTGEATPAARDIQQEDDADGVGFIEE